jgi:hypothetical protein
MPTTRVLLETVDHSDPASPRNRVADVDLPEGYYRVWECALNPGDLFLNRLAALDGLITWEPVTEFPTPAEVRDNKAGSTAGWYACLFRKGEEVVPACDRCKVAGRFARLRFCKACALILTGRE